MQHFLVMPKPSLSGRKRTRDLSGQDNSEAKKAALLAMKAHTQETKDLLDDIPDAAPASKPKPKKASLNTVDAKHVAKALLKQYQKLEAAGTPNRLRYSRQKMHAHILEEIKKAMLDFAHSNHALSPAENQKRCQLFVDEVVLSLQKSGVTLNPLKVIPA